MTSRITLTRYFNIYSIEWSNKNGVHVSMVVEYIAIIKETGVCKDLEVI